MQVTGTQKETVSRGHTGERQKHGGGECPNPLGKQS